MPLARLKDYLDEQRVPYATVRHSPTYSAQSTAAVTHTPGKELAKTVLLRLDGELAMAVVPASHRVELERLREAAGAEAVELATEREFKDRFPDCELGAMPPFGNLYGIPVYVSELLEQDTEISFNACSHSELMRLSYRDFKRLVKPRVVTLVSSL
jgi:Ala-tRNA(Pro) deacylase